VALGGHACCPSCGKAAADSLRCVVVGGGARALPAPLRRAWVLTLPPPLPPLLPLLLLVCLSLLLAGFTSGGSRSCSCAATLVGERVRQSELGLQCVRVCVRVGVHLCRLCACVCAAVAQSTAGRLPQAACGTSWRRIGPTAGRPRPKLKLNLKLKLSLSLSLAQSIEQQPARLASRSKRRSRPEATLERQPRNHRDSLGERSSVG